MFDISLMAVVTKAMGAFLVMMLLLMPYYRSNPDVQASSAALKSALSAAQKTLADLQHQLAQSTPAGDLAGLQRQLAQARAALEKSIQEGERIAKQADALSSQLQQAHQELAKLQAENQRLAAMARQATRQQAQLAQATAQNRQMQEQLRQAAQQGAEMQRQLQAAQQQASRAREVGQQMHSLLGASSLSVKWFELVHYRPSAACPPDGVRLLASDASGVMKGPGSEFVLGNETNAFLNRSEQSYNVEFPSLRPTGGAITRPERGPLRIYLDTSGQDVVHDTLMAVAHAPIPAGCTLGLSIYLLAPKGNYAATVAAFPVSQTDKYTPMFILTADKTGQPTLQSLTDADRTAFAGWLKVQTAWEAKQAQRQDAGMRRREHADPAPPAPPAPGGKP
ncbi:MAG: hypothetical protein KGL55_12205 [Rhodospirillales bacterium]|nr:hypothetical protein [Rhodospirillales bacterium]